MDPQLRESEKQSKVKPRLCSLQDKIEPDSSSGSQVTDDSRTVAVNKTVTASDDSRTVAVNKTVTASENTSPHPVMPSPPLMGSSNSRNEPEGNNDIQLQRSTSTQKSVCFHSQTGQPGANRKITNAIDCLQLMISGSSLIKIKASLRQYRRYYSLEDDLTAIRWTPSSKKSSKAKLPIKCIREIRQGKNTELLKSPDLVDTYSEDCSFSIMVGEDFESIDLIAASSEEANVWITGLNFLIGLAKSPDSFEGREKMREKWLVQVFDQADSDRTGTLDESETILLMKRLNSPLCIESLRQKIAEFELEERNATANNSCVSSNASSCVRSDSSSASAITPGPTSGISKNAFISLFNQTATRPDIYFILLRYCGRDYMSAEEFQLFLEGEQSIGGTSLELCREIIERFEPSVEARERKQFLRDGFSQFLLSESCDILNTVSSKQVDLEVMNLPFAHFFIASSFNTYLIEDQVKGPSSCEGYEMALLSGCRLVKIDTHDGPDGRPLVYHGNTLTSKICVESVLETIKQNAFVASPYPVIVLLENHCSISQQRVLAKQIQSIFGDALYVPCFTQPLESETQSTERVRVDSLTSERAQVSRTSPSLSSTSSDDAEQQQQQREQQRQQQTMPVNQGVIDYCQSENTVKQQQQHHQQRQASSLRQQTSQTTLHCTPKCTQQQQQFETLWNTLSPSQLKHRIILAGRKLARSDVDVDEITDDEDDNGPGSGNGPSAIQNDRRRTTQLCRELSALVSLPVRHIHWTAEPATALSRIETGELLHLSESTAVKIVSNSPLQCSDEFVSRNRTHLTLVTPNISRIDSSNMNPLDFFNTGVQFISMNYQTHSQIMDIYRGWFTQNGSCGYVPKPQFQREKYSLFNPRRKEPMPGIEQMNVRVKIISGQQLPRPRGASLKASSIDPYVTVQCLGVIPDCAEARTRTVSNNGHNPIFDESFDFQVTVPELALIRFLVLDDDFINDDFIGQLTIPVNCLQPGYKHVHLLDLNGEKLENASLFVKISLTTRASSKLKLRRKRSWSQKHQYETKQVGVRAIDEQFKAAFGLVHEIVSLRKGVEKYFLELCDECSLHESANLVQCLRIITIRLASCASVISYKVALTENNYPSIQVSGELTPKLSRVTTALDKALFELHRAKQLMPELRQNLYEIYRQFSRSNYEQQISQKENNNILSNLLENLRSTSPKYFKESGVEHSSNRSGYGSCDEDFSSTGSGNETVQQTPTSGKIGLKFNFSSGSGQNLSAAGSGSGSNSGSNAGPNATTPSTSGGSHHHDRSSSTNNDRFQRAGSSSNSPMGSFRSGSKRTEKNTENLYWNLSVIKAELDNASELENNCKVAFKQILRIAESLEKVFEREHKVTLRSNSCVVRELSNVSNSMSQSSSNNQYNSSSLPHGHYQQQQQQHHHHHHHHHGQHHHNNENGLPSGTCNGASTSYNGSMLAGAVNSANSAAGGGNSASSTGNCVGNNSPAIATSTATGTGENNGLRSILKKTSVTGNSPAVRDNSTF